MYFSFLQRLMILVNTYTYHDVFIDSYIKYIKLHVTITIK